MEEEDEGDEEKGFMVVLLIYIIKNDLYFSSVHVLH